LNSGTDNPDSARSDSTGILLVDAGGRIHLANARAASWLGRETGPLRGSSFVTCFAFEVRVDDPEMAQAQWELVLAGAQSVAGQLLTPRASPAGLRLRARAESAGGPDEGYLFTLSEVKAPAPPAIAEANDATSWLAHAGMGFFDLQLAAGKIHYSPAWKRQLG
jgi:hypothetical protein